MPFRLAKIQDCACMRAIYAQYIDTPITFELPSEEEFARRIAAYLALYPCIVCTDNGKIIGYAYAHRQQEREAYQWNAELSIYLDASCTSRGIGKKMYAVLLEILRRQGIRTAYGVVTVPNAKSEGLHRALGFRQVGLHQNAGYKCGAWHDVAWFAKALGPYDDKPSPLLPVEKIPWEELAAILRHTV